MGIVILPSQLVRREQIKVCEVHVSVGTGQILLPFPSWPRTPKGPSSPSAPSLLTAPLPLPSSCQPLASLPPPSTLPPSRKSEFVVEVKSDKLPEEMGLLQGSSGDKRAPGDQVGGSSRGQSLTVFRDWEQQGLTVAEH